MVIVTAGTSDLPVAEEARVTAEAWNCEVTLVADVGVAGLHRLLHQLPQFEHADAMVVVAGMEGALPSVVGGLVDCPVIAVPTSIGYGAHFQGLAALLGMLNSCASNVVVVNIDAGFNGGHMAGLIARRMGQARLDGERGRAGRRVGHDAGGRTGQTLLKHGTRPIRRARGRGDPWHWKRSTRSRSSHRGHATATRGCTARCSSSPADAGWPGRRRSAAAAALRSGAGLVRVATSAEVQPVVASFEPCYMTYPLPERGRRVDRLRPLPADPRRG